MGKLEENLIEPFAVQDVYVDGFTDHQIVDGVFSCLGYRLQRQGRKNGKPLKIVVIRIIMPAAAAIESNRITREAIAANPLETILMNGIGRH